MMWTVAAKNGLGMREGFSPNQLVFGRNLTLPNLIGKDTPSSLEREGEEEHLMGTLNVIPTTSGHI